MIRPAHIPALLPLALAAPLAAQSFPLADTEDASLSSVDAAARRPAHWAFTLDVRNGDYARGQLDDDDASLDRVPVHLALAVAIPLASRADGSAALFLIGNSSNGFHAPGADERATPRAFYESNNLLGLAWRPTDRLTAAALYTIKTSPNGVAGTSHEASVSLALSGDRGLAALAPIAAVTVRPKGGGGTFALVGIGPQVALGSGDDAPTLSFPAQVGIGFAGFYEPGSGDRLFGSAGLSFRTPLPRFAGVTFGADMLVLYRDGRLRRLDAPGGTTATIVPLGTISLRTVW